MVTADNTDDPRPEMVRLLANDAIDGMADRAEEATEDEVISAIFTLAMRMTKDAKARGGNMAVVKGVLMQMLLECADERRAS